MNATGRNDCSWEQGKDPVCMATKIVEDQSLKPLFVKKDGRGTSGQNMGLRWHYLKKDGEWARFPFSQAQDAKLRSAVCQQLLWSTCNAPIAKKKHRSSAYGPMVPKFKSVYKKGSRGSSWSSLP